MEDIMLKVTSGIALVSLAIGAAMNYLSPGTTVAFSGWGFAVLVPLCLFAALYLLWNITE